MCSVFSVQCSVFSVQCSVFGVRCSVFGVQCSVFGVRCSVFGVLSRWQHLPRQISIFAMINGVRQGWGVSKTCQILPQRPPSLARRANMSEAHKGDIVIDGAQWAERKWKRNRAGGYPKPAKSCHNVLPRWRVGLRISVRMS
jgi:hypothetical protein